MLIEKTLNSKGCSIYLLSVIHEHKKESLLSVLSNEQRTYTK